jgi:hypothetical protein
MDSPSVREPRNVAVRQLRRAPPAIVWKVLLGAAVLGRVHATQEAARTRASEEAAVATRAAQEARRTDSLRLAQAVESAKTLSRDEVDALDALLHAAPYTVLHDELHARAVRFHLDSASKLLARSTKSGAMLALALAQLSAVRQPTAPDQAVRLGRLTTQVSSIEQRIAADSLARVKADSVRAVARQRARSLRPAPQRPSHPSGASALCADGTYSYSANRRGTCSHHGGVSQWL